MSSSKGIEVYYAVLTILRAYKNGLQRAKDIEDPATRATLMLDKLLLFTDGLQALFETTMDFGMTMLTGDDEHKKTIEEQVHSVNNEMAETMRMLQDEIKMLSKWVQNPVMKETEKKFNELKF